MPGGGAGCRPLASSARDELEGSLGHGVIGLERLCRQQFFFSAIKVACLTVDDAELSVQIDYFRAIAAGSNRLFQLPDCLGPVMSLFGLNAVVRQRARTVEDTPLLLNGEVARHEPIRFGAIGRPQTVRQTKKRLAEFGIDSNRLAPGRYGLRGVRLLL